MSYSLSKLCNILHNAQTFSSLVKQRTLLAIKSFIGADGLWLTIKRHQKLLFYSDADTISKLSRNSIMELIDAQKEVLERFTKVSESCEQKDFRTISVRGVMYELIIVPLRVNSNGAGVMGMMIKFPSEWHLARRLHAASKVFSSAFGRVRHNEKNKKKWERTFNAIDSALCVIDREGQIVQANEAFCRLLQKSLRTIINADSKILLNDEFMTFLTRATENDCSLSEEIFLKSSNKIFSISSFPIRRGHYSAHRWVLLLSDITSQKVVQEQQVMVSKMKSLGELASGIAHEINNPLAAIVGLVDLWLEAGMEGLDREFQKKRLWEDLSKIKDAGLHASTIVKNLMIYSRAQKNQELQMLDLNNVVKQTLSFIMNAYKEEGIIINTQLQDDLPEIKIDRWAVSQAISNIIQNAKDAIMNSSKGSKIEIRTYAKDSKVVLEIEDDGPGIPPDVRLKIFDPFYTTREPGKGTGLGLAISLKVMDNHEGFIFLENGHNGGALFRIIFPVQKQ